MIVDPIKGCAVINLYDPRHLKVIARTALYGAETWFMKC